MKPWLAARSWRVAARIFGSITTAILIALSACAGFAHAAQTRGRVFFVSQSGNDANSGLSRTQPWRTVTRVNDADLQPGDQVLFAGGQTFSDTTLMPGQGFDASGEPGSPIVFGTYGRGRAKIPQGVWLGTNAAHPDGPRYLTFKSLALGPDKGFQGTGDYISLFGMSISHLMPDTARQEVGIQSEGYDWVIAHNVINDVGDSGMLLGSSADVPGDIAGGEYYSVHDNVITNTGMNPAIDYPAHGIYLKVARAHVFRNRISHFRNEGVSVRYRYASIVDNQISDGQIGIGWYQYDTLAGESRFMDNRISDMTATGIFVCGLAEGCVKPIESFQIASNRISGIHGRTMNLQPGAGPTPSDAPDRQGAHVSALPECRLDDRHARGTFAGPGSAACPGRRDRRRAPVAAAPAQQPAVHHAGARTTGVHRPQLAAPARAAEARAGDRRSHHRA